LQTKPFLLVTVIVLTVKDSSGNAEMVWSVI